MAAKKENKPKTYYVRVNREGCILGSLIIPADTLWPEIVTLFGKACESLCRQPAPGFKTRIEIDIDPIT